VKPSRPAVVKAKPEKPGEVEKKPGGVEAPRRPPRVRIGSHRLFCPFCGKRMPASSTECPHCGASAGREIPAGAPREVRPAGGGMPLGFFWGVLAAVAIFGCVLFLIYALPQSDKPKAKPVRPPAPNETTAPATQADLLKLQTELREAQDRFDEALKNRAQARELALAERRIDRLERYVKEEIARRAARLNAAAKKEPTPAPTPGRTPPAPVPPVPPEKVPLAEPPRPGATELRRREGEFERIDREARRLVDAGKYGQAIELWNAFPDYPEVEWQARRERKKSDIRRQVQERFDRLKVKAEKLVDVSKLPEAKAEYERALSWGIEPITQQARARLASIKALTAQRRTAGGLPELTEFTNPAVREQIQILRQSKDIYARPKAAVKLGELKATEAVPDLIVGLKDPDWYVRVSAARALTELKDERAIPALLDNLDYPMRPVQGRASEALQAITGQDFGRDPVKWRDWYAGYRQAKATIVSRPTPPEPRLPPLDDDAPKDAFPCRVGEYNKQAGLIALILPTADRVKIGQVLELYKGPRSICRMRVELVELTAVAGEILGPEKQRRLPLRNRDTVHVRVLP